MKDTRWKRQLPDKNWGDFNRRKQFEKIFKELQDQDISIKYKRVSSTDEMDNWTLRKRQKEGRLMWDIYTKNGVCGALIYWSSLILSTLTKTN
jgi:hypothetical protein